MGNVNLAYLMTCHYITGDTFGIYATLNAENNKILPELKTL
jgi:hypothetical protein